MSPLSHLEEIDDLRRDHPMLVSGLEFVERATNYRTSDVIAWFDDALVAPGFMEPPTIVGDPAFGTAPLHPAIRPKATRQARVDDVPAIAARARGRVVDALRGFIARPSDDRFLQAAIFAERVQRLRIGDEALWTPTPRDIDALANIVLSLFVADILTHREFYEARLCVCEVCGRVSFHPDVTTRRGCIRHTPRTESTSGFQTAAYPDDDLD